MEASLCQATECFGRARAVLHATSMCTHMRRSMRHRCQLQTTILYTEGSSHKISYKGSTRSPLCRMFKIDTFSVKTLRQVECLQGDITVIACINFWSICSPVHQRCSQFSKGIRVQQGDICSISGRPAQLWLRSLSRRHSLSFKLQCRLC